MKTVQIIDLGRGPQIEGSRITVMDVFYYLHRGRDFDFTRRAMPSLTREQFDAVVAYVSEHHDELAEKEPAGGGVPPTRDGGTARSGWSLFGK